MTPGTLDKAYATQLANIEKNSGKKLKEWITILNKSGFSKHGELVNFLKEKHGFTHGNANMLVHNAKQSHAAAAENDTDWIAEQYKGKQTKRVTVNANTVPAQTFLNISGNVEKDPNAPAAKPAAPPKQ